MTSPLTDAVDAVVAAFGATASRDASLAARSTYRVGGSAAVEVVLDSENDLRRAREVLAGRDVPLLVVGRGSNLLVADRGFPGVVVVLGPHFESVSIGAGPNASANRVRAGGAAALPVVARQTVTAGLTGFEWAVGVPGSIGGAVRMNAGGHGSEMAECLVDVRLVDLGAGVDRRVPVDELDLSYRHSALEPQDLVVDAVIELQPGDPTLGRQAISEIVTWRREHQPGGPNAGSVFTNPPGDSAGRLIDRAGGRGLRVGTAEVSSKHANFIQADEGGSADDIVALMLEMQALVVRHAGIHLVPETRLIGFDPDIFAAPEEASP